MLSPKKYHESSPDYEQWKTEYEMKINTRASHHHNLKKDELEMGKADLKMMLTKSNDKKIKNHQKAQCQEKVLISLHENDDDDDTIWECIDNLIAEEDADRTLNPFSLSNQKKCRMRELISDLKNNRKRNHARNAEPK